MDAIVKVIPSKIAGRYIRKHHYMGTFPNTLVNFGVFQETLLGVVSFGRSLNTINKAQKIIPDIKKEDVLELQRMHLSDVLGNNYESFVLGVIYSLIRKNTDVRLLITHSGGCKNDCGILYQAAGWLYFGKKECRDFYKTKAGNYKNIVAPRRFGKVPKEIKTPQETGEYLYGEGKIVESFRYLYAFPIDKSLRPEMEEKANPYPKDSDKFRKDQQWVE